MKKLKREIIAVLCLVLVILVFFHPALSGKKVFFGADEIASDLVHLVYTHNAFIYGTLARGKIPLWNPYAGSGSPLMGESQTGIYYPVQVLLYLLLPAPLAFNWLIISAFLIAAIGTYLYARSVGLMRAAAFLSAITFSLCGFMVGQVRHVMIIDAVAFLPFCLLVVEKVIKNPRAYWTAILAFLIYLSFAPGHLTSTYLLIFMLIAYFLMRIWFVYGREREESLRPIVIFFAGLLLGVVASAGTILPALEMVGYSSRATFSLESSLSPIYKFKYLLMFLAPYVFGDPSRGTWDMRLESYWENIGYIGVLPLGLAIWAAISGIKRKNVYILGATIFILFNFLLAFGNGTFLYRWIRDWIPGFSFTRVPGRFLLYIDFFLSILAGFGLTAISLKFKGQIRKLFLGAVVILTIFDLFAFGAHFNSYMPTAYYNEPETAKFLKKDAGLYRVRQIGFEQAWQNAWGGARGWSGDLTAYMNQRELLPPDYNMVFGISTPAFLYGQSGRYGVKRSIEMDQAVSSLLVGGDFSLSSTLLGMENVKYLVLPIGLPIIHGFDEVAVFPRGNKGDKTYIYKNKNWIERAFMVGRAVYAASEGSILGAMKSGEFDPAREVILEKQVDKPETNKTGKVTVNTYKEDRVEAEAESEEGGFLVLTDTYYPGWKATVDGQPVEILQADYAYRAVYLEKGKHKVVFSFEPGSVKIGAYVTFGTLFVILGIFVWDIKFFSKRQNKS